MRLIDADVLKGVFVGEYPGMYTKKYIKNLIDGMPTVGGWISVKERLPEPNVSVLLAVYDRDHGYTYRTVAWLNTSGDWDSNDDGFNQGDEDVLYWMPLPEPPEEVNRA